jgi:Family of unknown function (DUF5895)
MENYIMSDRFDSKDYGSDFTKLPICQLANKEDPANAGMIITMENAELAGFDPGTSKIWRKHTHRFRSGGVECYIAQNPRLVVFRQGPLVLRERNSDAYLGEFNKDRYNKATMYTSRSYLIFMVDEKNNILHSTPLKLSTKGSFSYVFGKTLQDWARDLSDAYIKDTNPDFKGQRGESFYRYGILGITLEPELKGDKEQSWVCDITNYDKPDEKTWRQQFLGYDDAVSSVIDQAFDDTATYFTQPVKSESDEVTPEPQSAFDIFLGLLDKAVNEVQVEQARAWVVSKQGESVGVTNAVSEALLKFKPVSVAPAASYEDLPF